MSNENATDEIKPDPFEAVTDHSNTADEFLQKLDLANDRWRMKGPWIFRGQNDATWKLQPSLFRHWEIDFLPQYELEVIDDFIRNANIMSLPIPANSLGYKSYQYRVNTKYNTRTERVLGDDSPYGLSYDFSHVAFALAQHSGVHTRLLDFSYKPLVAAYFAADTSNLLAKLGLSEETQGAYFAEFVNHMNSSVNDALNTLILRANEYKENMRRLPKNIVVWAIRVNDLHKTTLNIFDHPYLDIPNLRAQEGVFLCDTKYEPEKPPQEPITFNHELEKLITTRGIYKLTLPYPMIPRLFDLLGDRMVSYAQLHPSYELIAKAVLQRRA